MKVLEWSQYFSHNKSTGIFSDAEGQVTYKSLVGSCQISNPFKMLWLFSLPARIKKIQSKMKELEWSQDFPHYNPMGAICCHLIRSGPKPYAANHPHQWCSRWNLITIGQLVSEILMFENVDRRTHAETLACVPYYKLTLSLKIAEETWWKCSFQMLKGSLLRS